MGQVYPVGTVSFTAGQGINPDALNTLHSIEITEAHEALVTGAVQEVTRNQPNGFAGLDATSAIRGTVRVNVLTRTGADGIVPKSGEFIVIDEPGVREARFGNGIQQGGFSTGIGSPNCIVVPARGTPTENGQYLCDAYNYARTFNPYGNAKSATNKCYVHMLSGIYDVTGATPPLYPDVPFIEVIGSGIGRTRLYVGNMNIQSTCTEFSFRNLTFYRPTAGNYAWLWRFIDVPVVANWENILWEGSAITETIWQTTSRDSGTTSQFTINAKNCKYIGRQMFWSGSGLANVTMALDLDGCECDGKMFGPSTTANLSTVTGTVKNCKTGTNATNFIASTPFKMLNCDWSAPLNNLTTGVRIERTTFRTGATPSLGGNTTGQSVAVAHCTMAVANHATNPITNTLGTDAQAMNVRSDV